MTDAIVRSISAGLSQKGVRNHNERLLLSLLQRHGDLPGSDLARLSALSAPTVSAILKRLENDGLLERGDPQRGKVGKPSIPMRLATDAVFSFGLKVGRRSADLLLTDFTGAIRDHRRVTYAYPTPDQILSFLENGLREIIAALTPAQATRICGLGVAAPFEMWNWAEQLGAPQSDVDAWKDLELLSAVQKLTDLPVVVLNDATAACQAEHVYGRGKEFRDYAYFFIGAFVGGGVVLNHSVFEGRQGNAGALGSLRTVGIKGESRQLIDTASIHLLESRLIEADLDPRQLWKQPQDWSGLERQVEPWLRRTAQELAKASLSTCAVIDFEAVVIDGAFPPAIRRDLVERVKRYIRSQDMRGLIAPRIEEGTIGANARAIGAAGSPVFAQFLLNTNAGLSVA